MNATYCLPPIARHIRHGVVALLATAMAMPCHGEEQPDERPPAAMRESAPVPRPNAAPATQNHPQTPPDDLRDPFWPVEYVPPVKAGAVGNPETEMHRQDAEWRAAEKILDSMHKKGNFSRLPGKGGAEVLLILIGGKFKGVGETVGVSSSGKNYQWKVTAITRKDGPVFERIMSLPAPVAPAKKK